MKEIDTYILKLISAYISKEISEPEFNKLKQWLNEDPENKNLFSDYLYFYKKSRRIGFIEHLDKEKAWNNIVEQLKNRPELNLISEKKITKVRYFKPISGLLKYAAILVVGIVTVVYLNQHKSTEIESTNDIVLELSDGTKKTININNSQDITNSKGAVLGNQDKNKLNYQNSDSTARLATLSYNKLFVPYGKKIQVNLSDGSLIYLNSGSTLKYPIQFIKGMSREVFLEGEAYFIVSKNKNAPFIVHTNDLTTKVYGTEFNISSYQNDDSQEVVLVEGSVGVYTNNIKVDAKEQVLLVPNQKASFDKENQIITTEIVNVENYIAWKDGVLLFEKERFENIVRRLERHYNVSIQNNNIVLDDVRFTGAFDIETIEQVLKSFNSYKPFTYLINNDKIIINP